MNQLDQLKAMTAVQIRFLETAHWDSLSQAQIQAIDAGDIAGIADAVWAEVLSGTAAGTRLVELADAVAASNTSLTATEVWSYIIDTGKNQAAGDKLKKIATKTQDLALS